MSSQRSIHFTGRVRATSRPVKSSISGWEAAAIHYTLSYDQRTTDSEGRSTTRRVHVGSVDVSGDLTLDTDQGAVRVPSGSFIFDVGSVPVSPMPSTGRLPPELEALTGGRVEAWLVGERTLGVGDPVELVGTVQPASPPHALEVVPQTNTRIRDQSLDDMADDLAAMGIDPKAKGRAALVALALIGTVVVVVLIIVTIGLVG